MPPRVIEDKAPFVYEGETYHTWYKIVGDLAASASGCPLVVLHGGPGANHLYTLALADLAAAAPGGPGLTLIFYDQLGCGSSTHLPERGAAFWTSALFAAFWTSALFAAQLAALVRHLGLDAEGGAGFDVLGHSWGGMLAAWAAAKAPGLRGLRRLVLSNAPASMPLFEQGCRELLRAMPQDVQDAIARHEAAGSTDSEEYQNAVNAFYAKHLIRVPMPAVVVKSDEIMAADPTVFHTM